MSHLTVAGLHKKNRLTIEEPVNLIKSMYSKETYRVLATELNIEKRKLHTIIIRGKKYRFGDIKEWVMDKIMLYAVPIIELCIDFSYDESNKNDIEKQYVLYLKHRKNFAKISSLILLGHGNLKALFFHWIYWRYLRLKFDTGSHFLLYDRFMNDRNLLIFLDFINTGRSYGKDENDDAESTTEYIRSKTRIGLRNSAIKELYGNYNFWSWFRYMFLDGVNYKQIMLVDKTRVVSHNDKNWRKNIIQRSGMTAKDEVKKTNIELGKKTSSILAMKRGISAQAIADRLRKD